MTEKQPWAFVAHNDVYWAGVCSPDVGKKALSRFVSDFALDGFTITPVWSREEYLSIINRLLPWHESPEWKAKRRQPQEEPVV